MGYRELTNGFRIFIPEEGDVLVIRDVVFGGMKKKSIQNKEEIVSLDFHGQNDEDQEIEENYTEKKGYNLINEDTIKFRPRYDHHAMVGNCKQTTVLQVLITHQCKNSMKEEIRG